MTSTPFTMRLLPDELAILDAAASRLNVSRAAVVRELIHKYAGKLKTATMKPNDPTKPSTRKKPARKGRGRGEG